MSQIPYNPLENPEKATMTIDMHDGSNEQVSIIVVHRNRPEFLNMCLQSIHVMSNLNNYEVIVVDNASTDPDTADYLNAVEEEGVRVIRNKSNLYWSAAANKGAAIADKHSKYLFFMHADTVVLHQTWIDTMIGLSQSKGIGIVGCQMQHYYLPTMKQQVGFIPEWCVMLTRECWADCGPWSEELPLVGNSFIMSQKASIRGYKPSACTNNLVHHYRAVSYDHNEFEKINEKAYRTVPELMRQIQS